MATDLMARNPLSRLSMSVERFDDEQQVYIAVDPDVTKEWEIDAPPLGFELPGIGGHLFRRRADAEDPGDHRSPRIRWAIACCGGRACSAW